MSFFLSVPVHAFEISHRNGSKWEKKNLINLYFFIYVKCHTPWIYSGTYNMLLLSLSDECNEFNFFFYFFYFERFSICFFRRAKVPSMSHSFQRIWMHLYTLDDKSKTVHKPDSCTITAKANISVPDDWFHEA